MVQHIQNYHEYYAKDESWRNFVLHNKGPKAWEQDKAEREMVLTEFIPYLKQHCNLSAMEQTATAALREGQNISPEQAAHYNAVVAYVQDCARCSTKASITCRNRPSWPTSTRACRITRHRCRPRSRRKRRPPE